MVTIVPAELRELNQIEPLPDSEYPDDFVALCGVLKGIAFDRPPQPPLSADSHRERF